MSEPLSEEQIAAWERDAPPRWAGPVAMKWRDRYRMVLAEVRRLREENENIRAHFRSMETACAERADERDAARADLARAIGLLRDCYGLANGLPFRNGLTLEITNFLAEMEKR